MYDQSRLVVCTESQWRKENPRLSSDELIKATMVKRLPLGLSNQTITKTHYFTKETDYSCQTMS